MSEIKEVFPYLRLRNANAAVAFYIEAFGGKERFRLTEPSGRIGHVEIELGNSVLMLSDEYPECDALGPQSIGGTTMCIHLHVTNADAMAERAVAAGAVLLRPPTDHFYGERSCTLRDPFGHEWMIGHEIENVSPEEMQRRYDAMFT